MGSLIKTFINIDTDTKYAVPIIKNYVRKNNYKGFIMCDANGVIITNPNVKYIHQKFNGSDVFISAQSFQQNNKQLGNQIRKYVSKLIIGQPEVVCIGGESYLYGLTQLIPNIHVYTNSQSIYSDAEFNSKFNSNSTKFVAKLCDYNNLTQLVKTNTCLINLSNLNTNLLKITNMTDYNQIIIINCHHDDFWKKIKLLSNYKITLRKQFVSYELGYFITVSILQKNKLSIKQFS